MRENAERPEARVLPGGKLQANGVTAAMMTGATACGPAHRHGAKTSPKGPQR